MKKALICILCAAFFVCFFGCSDQKALELAADAKTYAMLEEVKDQTREENDHKITVYDIAGDAKSDFDAIKPEMSYKDVCTIIGKDGALISETSEKGKKDHQATYQWNIDGLDDTFIQCAFENDKMVTKTQQGLDDESISNAAFEAGKESVSTSTSQGDNYATIDIDEYNKITVGMTYDEACAIIGGEICVSYQYGDLETGSFGCMVDNDAKSGEGAATLFFEEGKLTEKSQYGLE